MSHFCIFVNDPTVDSDGESVGKPMPRTMPKCAEIGVYEHGARIWRATMITDGDPYEPSKNLKLLCEHEAKIIAQAKPSIVLHDHPKIPSSTGFKRRSAKAAEFFDRTLYARLRELLGPNVPIVQYGMTPFHAGAAPSMTPSSVLYDPAVIDDDLWWQYAIDTDTPSAYCWIPAPGQWSPAVGALGRTWTASEFGRAVAAARAHGLTPIVWHDPDVWRRSHYLQTVRELCYLSQWPVEPLNTERRGDGVFDMRELIDIIGARDFSFADLLSEISEPMPEGQLATT